jgi:hypothetical protein
MKKGALQGITTKSAHPNCLYILGKESRNVINTANGHVALYDTQQLKLRNSVSLPCQCRTPLATPDDEERTPLKDINQMPHFARRKDSTYVRKSSHYRYTHLNRCSTVLSFFFLFYVLKFFIDLSIESISC